MQEQGLVAADHMHIFREPYQCLGTVLPKGPLWCNADSLLYEDGLFD